MPGVSKPERRKPGKQKPKSSRVIQGLQVNSLTFISNGERSLDELNLVNFDVEVVDTTAARSPQPSAPAFPSKQPVNKTSSSRQAVLDMFHYRTWIQSMSDDINAEDTLTMLGKTDTSRHHSQPEESAKPLDKQSAELNQHQGIQSLTDPFPARSRPLLSSDSTKAASKPTQVGQELCQPGQDWAYEILQTRIP